jgi:ATP-dependent DNA helicase DinG
VPAILSRDRVLISTGTKNLQEQIFFKDIPALREALGVPFTATYMKGRANYLCLHKLDRLNDGLEPASHDVFLPIIRDWAGRTETGDRAELSELPEDVAFWNDVAATADTCLGTECPRYDECFVTKMRQRAAESDIVIVNHHLLCADAALRQNAFGEVIPRVQPRDCRRGASARGRGDAVLRLQHQQLPRRGSRPRRRAAGRGRRGLEPGAPRAELEQAVASLRDCARTFFTELTFAHRGSGTRQSRRSACERRRSRSPRFEDAAAMALSGALDRVESTLVLLKAGQPRTKARAVVAVRLQPDLDEPDEQRRPWRGAAVRHTRRPCGCSPARTTTATCTSWNAGGRGVFLRASPIDVSTIVRELLLDRMQTTVLTSATLTVDGAFEYIRSRTRHPHSGRDPAAVGVQVRGAGRFSTCRGACRTRGPKPFATGGRPRRSSRS